MKSFILALMLLSSSAFAIVDVCQLQDTHDFENFAEVSRTEGEEFSAAETAMIYVMMKKYSQGWRSYKNTQEAIFDFMDYDRYNDRAPLQPGTNAGEIVYYIVEGKTFALVHFWPGDNEYGSVFEISKSGKGTHVARITDGEVLCK